ncbi:TraR/DksA family transcriptional regulator [Amphritea sp. HPY]|uniref:TraR/DksA family transcriptional regulator n=1 Tax=Amphritea sp. HPY TaxID=3421652 RepID=UPI003D7CE142
MTDQELQYYRQLLLQLSELLSEEIADLQRSAAPVTLDQQAVGRVSRGDALQQQNMALANLEQCQQRLQQVVHARQKFNDNEHDSENGSEFEYGYCEDCDDLIPPARLKARPDSRYCIKCQAQQEQE